MSVLKTCSILFKLLQRIGNRLPVLLQFRKPQAVNKGGGGVENRQNQLGDYRRVVSKCNRSLGARNGFILNIDPNPAPFFNGRCEAFARFYDVFLGDVGGGDQQHCASSRRCSLTSSGSVAGWDG